MGKSITKEQAASIGFIYDNTNLLEFFNAFCGESYLVMNFVHHGRSAESTGLYVYDEIPSRQENSVLVLSASNCTFKNVSRICKALSLGD